MAAIIATSLLEYVCQIYIWIMFLFFLYCSSSCHRKSCHKTLIRFRSGVLSHSSAARAVCLGSVPSWKVKLPLWFQISTTLHTRLSFGFTLYLVGSIFPSSLTIHGTMLPPPCFTVRISFSESRTELHFCQRQPIRMQRRVFLPQPVICSHFCFENFLALKANVQVRTLTLNRHLWT